MRSLYCLALLLGGTCIAAQNAPEALPPDVLALLQTLPGQTLTLDTIVGIASKDSDSYRAVTAQLESLDASELESHIPLEYRVLGDVYRQRSQSELDPFFPTGLQKTTTDAGALGLSTYFRTGTTFEGKIVQTRYDRKFINPQREYEHYETTYSLGLKQNLLKDVIGYSTRLGIEAGELQRQALLAKTNADKEAWLLALIQLYYSAWLKQAEVKNASEGLKRRDRLVNITQIRSRRGFADRPDVLQVESAKLNSEVRLSSAKQSLEDVWRELILSLKLPRNWMEADPLFVPVALDEPLGMAQVACAKLKDKFEPPVLSSQAEQLRAEAQAAEALAKRASHAYLPTAEVYGTYGANGVDEQGRDTWKELGARDHPSWKLGLQLSFPLGFYAERAQAQKARTQEIRADALYAKAQSDLEVQWTNHCRSLIRLEASLKLRKQAYEQQAERERLEEDRYRIGRSAAINVIQAGDDAADARYQWLQNEIDLRLTSWKIAVLNRDTGTILK